LISAQRGKLGSGFTFAGANAYRVKEIVSVKELFQTLEKEYEEAVLINEQVEVFSQ
jgi:nitronate monooxygenase